MRINGFKSIVRALWLSDGGLTVTAGLMVGALVVSVVGLVVDPRVITGAPAWLKPAKFAASIAIYTATLAWVFSYLPDWRRMRRMVGWTTVVTLNLEWVIIAAQAARGTTSHFNNTSPLNAALFSVMGLAIVVQTLSSVAVAVAVWRQRFADPALGWALRLGLAITIVGASTGGLMVQPTTAQLTDARAGRGLPIAGAHTVGAPDGGPGLPGTGWSVEHGDIRVAHFVGLHAWQVLPLLVVAALGRRRWPDARRVRAALIAAASYALLFAVLLWQALRGQPLVGPDGATLAALAVWASLTLAGGVIATRGSHHSRV